MNMPVIIAMTVERRKLKASGRIVDGQIGRISPILSDVKMVESIVNVKFR